MEGAAEFVYRTNLRNTQMDLRAAHEQLRILGRERLDLIAQVEVLTAENRRLTQQVAELTATLRESAKTEAANAPLPPFVKPKKPARRRKRPGRKAGHPAALRPVPEQVDVHQDVPLPADPRGRVSCPKCNACLLDVKEHERIVEDVIIPEKVVVKCYHTQSGWCPGCRKVVESRHREQPPASNLPHGQLGPNALAAGVLLRIVHRLPFRQVSQVFANLPGLSVCPGAIARQVQRLADWLEPEYEKLKLEIRAAPRVHVDETGWPIDGRGGYLWGVTTPTQTLYHIDPSRGGKVIRQLLGEAFGGTLVSDFYSAYAAMDCKKQKCLTHLLREFKESAEQSPAFASGSFYPKAKRLVKDMLLLKGRWGQMGDEKYTSRACRLETRLDQLADASYEEPNERRIAKRMGKYRKELTAFLWEKELDGTNNAAERALRPAVVARKISGGSRSGNGANAFAKLASLLRTAAQQGKNLLQTIKGQILAAWDEGNPAVVPREE
jgi:transposase